MSTVDDVDLRVFYDMWYRDPLVDVKTTLFDVQMEPKWVKLRDNLFTAFFTALQYTVAYFFQDGIFGR